MSKNIAIDDKINELFKVLQKQKTDVEKSEKEVSKKWVTNCSFTISGRAPINIQTANEESIRTATTEMLMHQDYSNKAAEKLGLEKYEKYLGYTYDEWVEDFCKRIAVINLKAEKEKLANLEKRLGTIVSPEQKRQMELDAITNELEQ